MHWDGLPSADGVEVEVPPPPVGREMVVPNKPARRQRLRLVELLAKPGKPILQLGHERKLVRVYYDAREATTSDRCLAVTPREGLLAIDCDHVPEEVVRQLEEQIRKATGCPVYCYPSGGNQRRGNA